MQRIPRGERADRARYGLARALAASGERDRALGLLDELVKKGSPEWVDRCWLQIGLIRESAGRLAEAIEAISTLERVAPKSALDSGGPASPRGGPCRAGQGGRSASSCCGRWLTNGPESIGPRAALELATIQLAGEQSQEAAGTLESALKRYPKSPDAAALEFRLAEALRKLNRPAEAEARFLKVAEGFPDDAWADDAMLRAAQSALERGDCCDSSAACRRRSRRGSSRARFEVKCDWFEARAAALIGSTEGRRRDS